MVQFSTGKSFQRMDDTFTGYGASVDNTARTSTLIRASKPAGPMTFEQPTPERLILAGEMDGRNVRMELQSFDLKNFRLLQSEFCWVQDFRFNR